jgi:catechol 2,3-dioxygenase-like lactoylglutathione lyase family enzyme
MPPSRRKQCSPNIASVTICVSDQDQALDSYVNKLGFEKRANNLIGPSRRWVTIARPGGKTEIVLAKGFGGWSAEKVGEFSRIVLRTTDAQATDATLRDCGVTFSEPPTAQPWGMSQTLFEDQDGNGYVLIEA